MKNIVLKVPTAIFIVLVFLPFIIFAMQMLSEEELLASKHYDTLSIIGSIVTSIWLFSIVDYFQSKAVEFKFTRLIYGLLSVELIMGLLTTTDIIPPESMTEIILSFTQSIVYISVTVFITLLVHKVFYERAVWFVVLELLIPIIGITTLTPEIKRNEK
jgi:hypothetical protein